MCDVTLPNFYPHSKRAILYNVCCGEADARGFNAPRTGLKVVGIAALMVRVAFAVGLELTLRHCSFEVSAYAWTGKRVNVIGGNAGVVISGVRFPFVRSGFRVL